MKNILIVLGLLMPIGLIGQVVEVDSKEYHDLKVNNGLMDVVLELNEDMFKPKKPFTPIETSSNASKAGACDCYVEPDTSYTLAMGPNDDGSSALITIPFNFCFYGQTYNSFYINNNGNITFDNILSAFSATAFPSVGPKIIAPFWGDVDTGGGNGTVVYKITPTAVYVNWEDVGYFSQQGDKLNTFQLIITDGIDPVITSGNVAFCYQDMQWTTGSASGGVGGFGGTPATAGTNKGDGISYFLISRFDHPGVDFDGALGNPDGISWLDDKSFFFDICNTTNIPPIPEGISLCDTFKICSLGDTADIPINFLSPEVNQITSVTFNNGGLASLIEVSNTPGNTAQIVLRAIGTPADIGVYSISVTATDDFVPAGVTTITFVLVIDSLGSAMDPQLAPLVGCDSVTVSVLNGPYDTYLWDDLTVGNDATVNSTQTFGVTVSLGGCYKRVEEPVIISNAPVFNLPTDLNFCGNGAGGGLFLDLDDSLNMTQVSWGLLDPVEDSSYSNTLPAGTYTINAMDAYGLCSNDTTFTINEYEFPQIFGDTLACNLGLFMNTTVSEGGGVWQSADTSITFYQQGTLIEDNTIDNPQISTSTPGTYTVSYTDNTCNVELIADITFPPYVWVGLPDTVLCYGVSYELNPAQEASVTSWDWNTGSSDSMIVVTQPGVYTVTVSNICHSGAATAVIGYKVCDIAAPNILSLSSAVGNNIWFVESEGIESFECNIVNRWGNNIYSFDSTTGGWNGRNSNGGLVKEGTYFYIINAVLEGGEELTKHGFIQVVY